MHAVRIRFLTLQFLILFLLLCHLFDVVLIVHLVLEQILTMPSQSIICVGVYPRRWRLVLLILSLIQNRIGILGEVRKHGDVTDNLVRRPQLLTN